MIDYYYLSVSPIYYIYDNIYCVSSGMAFDALVQTVPINTSIRLYKQALSSQPRMKNCIHVTGRRVGGGREGWMLYEYVSPAIFK